MKRALSAFLWLSIVVWCGGCGNSAGSSQPGGALVNITNAFSIIEAGSAPITLTANVAVTWSLTLAGGSCSGCGTLKPADPPGLSAIYTPPPSPPLNREATITARSTADSQEIFVFNFQILPPISVSISPKFTSVNVGGPVQDLTANVSNDFTNSGVTWTLTVGGSDCQQPPQGGCGTLTVDPAPLLTAHYQPPATPPSAANASPTITATSIKDPNRKDSFGFSIVTPAITVTITNKFPSASVGGQAMTLNASITHDFLNQGLTWTITAGGVNCQQPPQGCGTLTVDPSPSLTAHYQPPATPPSTASASPTITAIAVADTTKKDSFNFNIVTPPLTVRIVNKFTSAFTGGQPVTVNASLMNDFLNQGVAWTLTSAGAACTAACGTLTPVGNPSTSATYTPPPSPLTGPTPSPTITATSISDTSKSDNFTFSLIIPNSLVKGSYAFLLRGYDSALHPMALAGSLTADGIGNITGGEYDLNDSTTITSVAGPLSGSYTVDMSFSGIPRVTLTITGGGTTKVLKCALSADGKRGKVIELDGSLALNAGSLALQDSAAVIALATSTGPTKFAFGLDSDAPINGRVVEAGQFILGAGAASVTGGIADEGQAGAANPIFGGVAGPAAVAPASSSVNRPDALGRGTLTLSIGGSATQYAYYVVDSSQLNLIEIDAGGTLKTVQAGTARNQSALSATSINATSVAALTGMTTVGGAPSPDVIIGVLSNSSGAAPVVHFDSNNAGTVALNQTATGSFAVPFDATTGRTVIAGTFFPDAVVYLYDSGNGFIADVTPSANGVNHGLSGPLMVQTVPAAGFNLQSLSGNSIALAGGSSNSSMANLDQAVHFDGGGNYTAELDYTTSSIGQGQNFPLNSNDCGCTYQVEDAVLGRGELLVFSSFFNDFPNHSDTVSFYLIGQNQFVAIEDQGLSASGSPSDILFFDPQ